MVPMTGKSVTANANYSSGLCDADRERYAQKLDLCGFDPFELDARDCLISANILPRVNMCDIHYFLVLRTSFLTRKQLKSYKSLEGHNYVTSGWVREPWVKQTGPKTVAVLTRVRLRSVILCAALTCFLIHAGQSQSLSIPPVKAWICAKSDVEVLAAHCLCMAGNGETCSHVQHYSFTSSAREERSCTDSSNDWLPAHVRKIEAQPVAKMDFASATMKKR